MNFHLLLKSLISSLLFEISSFSNHINHIRLKTCSSFVDFSIFQCFFKPKKTNPSKWFSKVTVAFGSAIFGLFYGAWRSSTVTKIEKERIRNLQKVYDQRMQLPAIELKKENGMKRRKKTLFDFDSRKKKTKFLFLSNKMISFIKNSLQRH